MNDQWPPPGHTYSIHTKVDLQGRPHYEYDLSLPLRAKTHLETVRMARHGGPTPADEEFRTELYRHIGAIAVAGGHVETAMKRVLLVIEGSSGQFSEVDKSWSYLHANLRKRAAAGSTPLRIALGETLDWGDRMTVKERRDNAIHAYWWDYAGCGVIRSRFQRKNEGVTLVGSLGELRADADLLFEYANRLDDLVVSDWPQGRFPAVTS